MPKVTQISIGVVAPRTRSPSSGYISAAIVYPPKERMCTVRSQCLLQLLLASTLNCGFRLFCSMIGLPQQSAHVAGRLVVPNPGSDHFALARLQPRHLCEPFLPGSQQTPVHQPPAQNRAWMGHPSGFAYRTRISVGARQRRAISQRI